MAWYSYTAAFIVPSAHIAADADPRQVLNEHQGDADHTVFAPSRNGHLLRQLGDICKLASNGKDLYLLQDACLLRDEAIGRSVAQIEALVAEIEASPALVIEATKEPYEPNVVIHAEGFKPLPAEVVYARDATIKNGWVYHYTEKQVRGFLDEASASPTPCPDGDDDGESLTYVFSFLKSHLALLRHAAKSGGVVVYGETNP